VYVWGFCAVADATAAALATDGAAVTVVAAATAAAVPTDRVVVEAGAPHPQLWERVTQY